MLTTAIKRVFGLHQLPLGQQALIDFQAHVGRDIDPSLVKPTHRHRPSRRLQRRPRMDALSLLQWPAMAVTVGATWLVGSNREGRRQAGFWLFLGSNALWAAWGLYDDAPALVTHLAAAEAERL